MRIWKRDWAVLEIEVKGEAQETIRKHFLCYLNEFHGPISNQGQAELVPATFENF